MTPLCFLIESGLSDLHEETRQQRSLDVDGVDSRAEGRRGDGQLDPAQGGAELGVQGVRRHQGRAAQVHIPTPLVQVAV